MNENHEQTQTVCIGGNLASILAQRKQTNGTVANLYKPQSDSRKAAMLAADVRSKTDALIMAAKQDRVNLEDFEAVQARVVSYLDSCAEASVFPSFQGVSAFALGRARQVVYRYINQHPETPTAQFLELVREAIGDIIMNAALQRTADNASAIFLLKNSHGFSDRVEIEPVQTARDESHLSVEDMRRRYEVLDD